MVKRKKQKKQRRSFALRKLHLEGKELGAHLSKELRKSLGMRSLQLRKGDKVKVMRGSHNGFSGKIIKINRRKCQVFLENLNRKKADGTEVPLPLHPSNLLLVELERSDEKRIKVKKKTEKPAEEGKEKKGKEKAEKQETKRAKKVGE